MGCKVTINFFIVYTYTYIRRRVDIVHKRKDQYARLNLNHYGRKFQDTSSLYYNLMAHDEILHIKPHRVKCTEKVTTSTLLHSNTKSYIIYIYYIVQDMFII